MSVETRLKYDIDMWEMTNNAWDNFFIVQLAVVLYKNVYFCKMQENENKSIIL